MLTWVFFLDVIVIALELEGREEVKVIIVDGDQRVGHITFFFELHCTGSKVNLGSASPPADMVSGLYKVPDMLLRSCWLTRAWTYTHTHTHSRTLNHLYHLADKVLPDRPVTHTSMARTCACVKGTLTWLVPATDRSHVFVLDCTCIHGQWHHCTHFTTSMLSPLNSACN